MFSTYEYEDENYIPIIGAEPLDWYEVNGLHPVLINDVIGSKRYRVVDKLGYGDCSTVWLVQDPVTKGFVAAKIMAAHFTSTRESVRESNIMAQLSCRPPSLPEPGQQFIPPILDSFSFNGPNGAHTCIVMPVARCSLRQAHSDTYCFPLPVARALAGNLASAVAFLHSRGHVHGDIHMGNVLTKMNRDLDKLTVDQYYEEYGEPTTSPVVQVGRKVPSLSVPREAVLPAWLGLHAPKYTLVDTDIFLSDFGSAQGFPGEAELRQEYYGRYNIIPPEALWQHRNDLGWSADIWMLGMTIWEIVASESFLTGDYECPLDFLSEVVGIFGPAPPEWKAWWPGYSEFFNEAGEWQGEETEPWTLDDAYERFVHQGREVAGQLDAEEKAAFLAMMRGMMALRPSERWSIEQVLESEWMVKWALKDTKH